jgi:hypothetical protein
VQPDYGVDLFEEDYLFLLPVADLRMDPGLRPRPVSSLTSVTLHNSTTHREFFLSARGTVLGALCAHRFFGFVGTTGVLSASVSDFMVWDGGLPFSGIS